ncbi:MAG: hypothetical protein AAFZ99_00910 [Pseudomonadota bacterium]
MRSTFSIAFNDGTPTVRTIEIDRDFDRIDTFDFNIPDTSVDLTDTFDVTAGPGFASASVSLSASGSGSSSASASASAFAGADGSSFASVSGTSSDGTSFSDFDVFGF